MKRTGDKAKCADPSIISGHNLTLRYARGELAVQELTDETTKRPATRIRKIGAIDRLRARGSITQEQYMAAEKYATLYEAADGAHQDRPDWLVCADCSAVGSDGPTAAQMDALKELREVNILLGSFASNIAKLVAVCNLSAKDIGLKMSISQEKVSGYIDLCLTRLAEYWGYIQMVA